jgi:hypothetical protein
LIWADVSSSSSAHILKYAAAESIVEASAKVACDVAAAGANAVHPAFPWAHRRNARVATAPIVRGAGSLCLSAKALVRAPQIILRTCANSGCQWIRVEPSKIVAAALRTTIGRVAEGFIHGQLTAA